MEKSKRSLDDTIQYTLIQLIRLSLVGAAIWLGFQGDWPSIGITMCALLLVSIPKRLEERFNVVLPIEFSMVIVLFIYTSTFLGEVGDAYEKFWWWDGLLHITSGVILGFAGFLILYSLFSRKKLQAGPFLLAFFGFCFALAAGTVWELFEFAMDRLFGLHMQKGGLNDTMVDLAGAGGGALVVSYLCYRYMKYGASSVVSRFTENFLRINPHIRKR